MEVTTTSSLKPSSGETKTISQPAALAARALSLTPLIVPGCCCCWPLLEAAIEDDRVEVLGGGNGGCLLILFSVGGGGCCGGCSNEL